MVMASGSADYLGLANAPVLWILALAVMGVVVVQSLIYMSAVKKNAESAGMSQHEVRSAFRAGGVAAIGPSLSVVLVAIALLPPLRHSPGHRPRRTHRLRSHRGCLGIDRSQHHGLEPR